MDGIGEFSLQVVRVIARTFFEALFDFLFRLVVEPIGRVVGYLYGELLRDARWFVRYDVFAIPLAMLLMLTSCGAIVVFSVKAVQWAFF